MIWQDLLPSTTHLRDIYIPGTHDSGARNIDFIHDTLHRLKKFGRICFLRRITINFAKTQRYDIATQLSHGIRYIDLRISKWGDTYFVSHTFSCAIKASDVLTILYDFVRAHPTEFILLHMVPDSANQDSSTAPEIESLWNHHIVSTMDYFATHSDLLVNTMRGHILWLQQSKIFQSLWYNMNRAGDLDIAMTEQLPDDRIWYSNYVLTPNAYDIGLSIMTLVGALLSFFILLSVMIVGHRWLTLAVSPVLVLCVLMHLFYRPSLEHMTHCIQRRIYEHHKIICMDFYTKTFLETIILQNQLFFRPL